MNNDGKRGGWNNPASAENGRKASGGGRPRIKAEFRRGEQLIIERAPLVPSPSNPFQSPEHGVVLSVSEDEIEIQIGDGILVIRRSSMLK